MRRFLPVVIFSVAFQVMLKGSLSLSLRLMLSDKSALLLDTANALGLWFSFLVVFGMMRLTFRDYFPKYRALLCIPAKPFVLGISIGFAFFLARCFLYHPRTSSAAMQTLCQQSPFFLATHLLPLIVVIAAATLGEECVWRGVFLESLLRQRVNPLLAIALSAVLFGFWHLLDHNHNFFDALSIILCGGLQTATAYYCTRNLGLCWGLHFGINLAALVTDNNPFSPSVTSGLPVNVVSYVLCLLLGLLLTYWLYKKYLPESKVSASSL